MGLVFSLDPLVPKTSSIPSSLLLCPFPHTGSSIPPSHFCVSPLVGAGCVRRPSSISLTCRSTPSRTQRPNLTSVLTAPSHSPTPATWPSTSASIAGPSPTPAPTARNLSGSSVTYSSTHGTYWPLPVLPFTTSPKLHFLLPLPARLHLTCRSPYSFLSPCAMKVSGVMRKHILHSLSSIHWPFQKAEIRLDFWRELKFAWKCKICCILI